ncbi:hypothetical protein Pyn_11222 [Prunus yedoensis var. nudiflora]|uniref:TF-B3 domain-containing protein n=1 Tax=Prunus yedoensis var. nudiflora TaxID=2094558 RepID=A0A314ZES4_PRUYE|nr:hypothetical protein Pyn_11222 [Prunus yedoensis var. nudiflora]
MGIEKCLTEIDIVSRFVLPIDWIRMLPPIEQGSHEVNFQVTDGLGYIWEFCCSIRRVGRYRKPVLQSEGWLKFVNYKGLKVGDKIVLDTEANDFRGTQFRIRAQKLNKECDQWVDV